MAVVMESWDIVMARGRRYVKRRIAGTVRRFASSRRPSASARRCRSLRNRDAGRRLNRWRRRASKCSAARRSAMANGGCPNARPRGMATARTTRSSHLRDSAPTVGGCSSPSISPVTRASVTSAFRSPILVAASGGSGICSVIRNTNATGTTVNPAASIWMCLRGNSTFLK
jgi:hypothetical protein